MQIINIEEFKLAKSRDLISLKCEVCDSIFLRQKNHVQAYVKNNYGHTCSKKCQSDYQGKRIIKQCGNCFKDKSIQPSEIKKTKSGKVFCNHSCSSKYNNSHKVCGSNRAKLELWLESQLNILYPNLKIEYNYILSNGCELDIFISSLNLAFELNGIFHYEPIFGANKLEKIQERDTRKFKHCIDNNIGLCVIDTSKQKRVTPETSKEFLDIIINIINNEIGGDVGIC